MADPADPNERFGKLYATESSAIFRFCFIRTSDVEVATDITQDVFVSVWDIIANGDDLRYPRALLFKIARNRIIDWYRKKKDVRLESLVGDDDDPDILSFFARVESTSEQESEVRLVIDMMKKLPDEYREAVYLRFVEGLDLEQIAEMAGESVNTISVRIHRGLKKLRTLLHYEA